MSLWICRHGPRHKPSSLGTLRTSKLLDWDFKWILSDHILPWYIRIAIFQVGTSVDHELATIISKIVNYARGLPQSDGNNVENIVWHW